MRKIFEIFEKALKRLSEEVCGACEKFIQIATKKEPQSKHYDFFHWAFFLVK